MFWEDHEHSDTSLYVKQAIPRLIFNWDDLDLRQTWSNTTDSSDR
jgi:hypothetical protein